MIIWTGWGFLVAVIFFTVSLITEKLVESTFSNSYYYQQNGWPKLLASLISAALVWLLCKYFNVKKIKNQKLFFIDISKWPFILVFFGILLFIFGNSSF